MKRPVTSLIVAAALSVVAVAPAAAVTTPTAEQVMADWADNQIVDGSYPPDVLHRAMDIATGRDNTLAMRAINDALSRELFGAVAPERAGSPVRGNGAGAGDSAGSASHPTAATVLDLPNAGVVGPDSGIPVPFIVLSAMAGLLVLAGGTSTVVRRLSRDT
ncbi:MAG: hypothetical protein U0Y82_04420 [Thermoleophilia bacterium]